jgi:hypothetical protein
VIYTLVFIAKFGLWELKVDHFRTRFYRTRDEAMKTVTRYRRATQTIYDREELAELELKKGDSLCHSH